MNRVLLVAGCLTLFVFCETSNVTSPGSTDVLLDRMPPEIKIPTTVGMTIISCVAVAGNSLTIYAYITDSRLRSIYDMYILNLAAVDMCIACISIPVYIIYSFNGKWIFGRKLCKIWLAADFTFCQEAVMMIMVMSLDRLLYIKLGIKYVTTVTRRIAKLCIFVSWLVSFFVYAPAIMWWDHWVGYSTVPGTDCHVEFAYDFQFTIGAAVLDFFLPALVLTTVNGLIYRDIRGHLKRRKRIAPEITGTNSIMAEPSGSQVSHWSHNSRKIKRKPFRHRNSYSSQNARDTPTFKPNHKRFRLSSLPEHIEIRHIGDSWCRQDRGIALTTVTQTKHFLQAARNLAFLVAVFFICWAPYTILTVVLAFCRQACINAVVYELFYWWLWVKSGINPFLYAYSNSKYRANFHKCLTCKCMKKE